MFRIKRREVGVKLVVVLCSSVVRLDILVEEFFVLWVRRKDIW